MGIEHFISFLITALVFVMTPGMDTVFVLNKSIGQGRRSGIYATLGINSGILVHTLFAAVGLSVVIANSAWAFQLIKYAGAVYLIYLGAKTLMKQPELLPVHLPENHQANTKNDYWSGFMTNTLNPKVALFFLAFFPQFIDPDQMNNPIPFILLGLTYASIGLIWYLILSLSASAFSRKILAHPSAGQWISKCSGLVFILIGIKVALSKS